MPSRINIPWLQTVRAAALAMVLTSPAHAAQSTTPSLPSTPQTSAAPATPQVPSSGARYNYTSTTNAGSASQSPAKDATSPLVPSPNSALAPPSSPTFGPGALGRDTDPGPASRGKAYNVRPINPY